MKRILLLAVLIPGVAIQSCRYQASENDENSHFQFVVTKPSFPEQSFVVTEFGAVSDGIVLNTEAFNKAITECNKKGGGRVIIPAGIWLTGPIHLQSDVNLVAEEGAIIVFSRNFDDYPFIPTYFEGKKDFRAMPLLYGDSLENVAITGKGIFDGSGDAWRPVKKMKMTENQWKELLESGGAVDVENNTWWPNEYAYEASKNPEKYRSSMLNNAEREKYKAFFRPPLVQLVNCRKVLLEGPLFQNSPGWCIHPLMCTDLTVNSITARNPWYAQNGDGIDIESCRNVRIINSLFDVGDDAICLKSGRDEEGRKRAMPCQFVEVYNCTVHHGHGGFVIGSEMSGGVHDIWVNNCSFTGTDIGLRFKSTRGRGGVVENVNIKNIRMINIVRDAIIFDLFYAGNAPTEVEDIPVSSIPTNVPQVTEETPEFKNILFSNISCMGAQRAVQIMGLPEMPVNGITIENSVFIADEGINCFFASNLVFSNLKVLTVDTPTIILWNTSGVNSGGISGNNKTMFKINGSSTEDILINTENKQEITKMLDVGEEIKPEEIKIKEL